MWTGQLHERTAAFESDETGAGRPRLGAKLHGGFAAIRLRRARLV